ncbi:MAG: PEGA domain-containing protein [Methanoregula sp.]|nr:PEGA domain-containing protein [Methanoregula sp.]
MPQKYTKIILLLTVIVLLVLPATALVPPGRIIVYSTPQGANACIDNKNCDITPSTFAVEGNAWHMIVVTEKGYRDWTETVYVTSDQTSVVNAYLDQDPAATAIRVNVTPGGGTICLDNSECRNNVGTVNSTASALFTGVSPGYHTISVESPAGYMDTMKLVQVNLGKTTEVNITLDVIIATPTTPKPPATPTGMVRVYVDRTGSTICMDNARCVYNVGGNPGPGTGTTIIKDVTVNETHIVTVAADGYEPFSATVSVSKDMIEKVDVSLQPIAGVTTVRTTTPPPATTVPATTTLVSTTPIPPIPTKSGMDAVPLFMALALCGMVFLFRKNRE